MTYYYDLQRHLVCVPYNVENLHRMAEELGIRRHWFHGGRHPHYDIPKRMVINIGGKAVKVSSRQILEIINGKKNSQS